MNSSFLSSDLIATKIYFIRGEKVLLDADLAGLYAIETKRLKEAVRRNIARFPEDFMFQLTTEEWISLRPQFASFENGRGKHSKYPPFAFTEQGVAMLSGVLNSKRAIETNIAIMRTFVTLRKWMQTNKILAEKIHKLENKYDEQFKIVFEVIRELIREENEHTPIGFRIGDGEK